MEVRAGRPALPPFIERGAHPTLRQDARPPQPRAAAVTGAAMRTGLHMRDLLLLRGLECSPVLAMDSGNGKAWMTVTRHARCGNRPWPGSPSRAPGRRAAARAHAKAGAWKLGATEPGMHVRD